MNIRDLNTNALAYVGDAVYEMEIRRYLLEKGEIHGDMLHRKAIKYVSAHAQAGIIKECLENLTLEEQGVVRRARNRKITSKPANVKPMTYKWATALEALLGWTYLKGDEKRLKELVNIFIEQAERTM